MVLKLTPKLAANELGMIRSISMNLYFVDGLMKLDKYFIIAITNVETHSMIHISKLKGLIKVSKSMSSATSDTGTNNAAVS